MVSDKICSWKEYSFEDLQRFTNCFSEYNFIGKTQFGKVYHGTISQDPNGKEAQHVTVKIWMDRELYKVQPEDKISRLEDEIHLLRHHEMNSHPNLVKLIGYCREGEQVGVVYDLKSLGTVYDLIFKDSFTWLRRIKVAVGFACLLDFLHTGREDIQGHLVRNISPAHIMLDEEFCPRLFDFGMLSGGYLFDKTNNISEKVYGCLGYNDVVFSRAGFWVEGCDVYSYGCVLIGLIANRVYNEEGMMSFDDEWPFADLFDWAHEAYNSRKYTDVFGRSRTKCSLVHESLKADKCFYNSDGRKITKLMIQCVDDIIDYRPSMKEVVRSLLKLRVVRQYADVLGIKHMFRRYNMLNLLPACVR